MEPVSYCIDAAFESKSYALYKRTDALTYGVSSQVIFFHILHQYVGLAVLTVLWRQVPSVQELTRMLAREHLLWCKAVQVSEQAVSQRFLSFPAQLADLLGVLSAKTLLILDRGFYHFQFWAQLIDQQAAFICRLKAGASYTTERAFTDPSHVRDYPIELGVKRKNACLLYTSPSPRDS